MNCVNDKYVIFTILGKVDSEDKKVFRNPQWKDCSNLLDGALNEFKKTAFYSSCDVLLEIPLKPRKTDSPDIKRITTKKVPLGRLLWRPDHNEKWTSKLDEQMEFPVIFLCAVILSSKEEPPEIQVVIKNSYSDKYNQVLSLAIHNRLYALKGIEFWNKMIQSISELMNAVRVGKTMRPWSIDLGLDENGFRTIHSIGGVSLAGLVNTLDLDESYQEWIYLK